MLREEYVSVATRAHVAGARFMRDAAAAVLPCCTLWSCPTALAVQHTLTESEALMRRVVELGSGLMEEKATTKYTAVIEARMRLTGVTLDCSITQNQTAAERVHSVPPGTRGDVYAGLIALSAQAANAADTFTARLDGIIGAVREGRTVMAVPLTALRFLHRLCADYAAVARKLANGEEAELVRREDWFETVMTALGSAASAEGVDAALASAETLCALASSGLIPSLPAVLFDIVLRYERLPVTFRRAEEECAAVHA